MNCRYRVTVSYQADEAFSQVALWLKSRPRGKAVELIIQALTAYYYPHAVRSRDAIATARRVLEQRLFDLIELERSLSETCSSLEDFGVDGLSELDNNTDNF